MKINFLGKELPNDLSAIKIATNALLDYSQSVDRMPFFEYDEELERTVYRVDGFEVIAYYSEGKDDVLGGYVSTSGMILEY